MSSRRLAWAALVAVALAPLACGDDPKPPAASDGGAAGTGGTGGAGGSPATSAVALMRTLSEMAAFGQKRVGTAGGAMAQSYMRMRMSDLGLAGVTVEPFGFPRHDVLSSSLSVTIGGAASTDVGFDVFEGSGAGDAEGEVVYVGSATPSEVADKVRGKIALVERNANYHRSVQYKNVFDGGALAMLYISKAPDNLRQVGSVRLDFGGLGPIPAITVGADDGGRVLAAVMAQTPVRAHIAVDARNTPAQGGNVIGRIAGKDAALGQIVVGAHFDTWFVGSVDNTSGVTELLALAEVRLGKPQPRYSIVFVAYDGEEVGLYGGYDYVRKHRIAAGEPVLAMLNFEMPSSKDSALNALAHSNTPALEAAIDLSGLKSTYPFYTGMEAVPMLFGGIIPTDIQGAYRFGLPTTSTVVDTAYYHTTADTPDKVDLDVIAESVGKFDRLLDELMKDEPAPFAAHDPEVWQVQITPSGSAAFDLVVRDGAGALQSGAAIVATAFYEDFFQAAAVPATTDASGHAAVTFPAAVLTMGTGNRWLHVTAGKTYPLAEQIQPLTSP